jgi:4-hydroxyphenylpyruvate dioxygenase
MLTALGFVPTAKHRRKAVTRWQQGDINIVMNCEPEGLAHSFDAVHGASVCALGLKVRNVPAALERAEQLAIPRFMQAVRPDELKIPSVKGVGGSLIYFIEDGTEQDVWRHEFTQAVPHDARRARCNSSGRTIVETMQYEEFVALLRRAFTVSRRQIEIAVMLGLVQSQAVESPDRALRIVERLDGCADVSARSSALRAPASSTSRQTADIFAAAEAASE